jgi:ribonuclease HI
MNPEHDGARVARASSGEVHVHFDGACEPPRGGGVATYGFTVEGEGLDHEEKGLAVRPWSPRATNNVAEYTAAIRALEWLAAQGYSGKVRLLGDSQLVVRQMQGQYRVRMPHLREYWERLRTLARHFEGVDYVWIPREINQRADELSKEALVESLPEARRHAPASPVEPEAEDEEPGRPGRNGPDRAPGP